MKSTARRHSIRVGVVAIALALTFELTGCLQSPAPLPSSTPGATGERSAPPTTASSPIPSTAPQKYSADCTTLLTDAQVYDYNPNYVVEPDYAPKRGSIPAAIAANLGQTCGWINESSGAELEVAIAAPTPSALAAATAAASGGIPISTAGNHGFFAVKNGVGSAQFFYGSLWLDVSSPDFATVADAETLYPIVVKNQRSAGG